MSQGLYITKAEWNQLVKQMTYYFNMHYCIVQ